MILALELLILFCVGAIAKSIHEQNILEDGPLNLTPYIDKGETDKARNLSAVDPTLFAGVHSHAAFITVNKTNKWNQFFWFFPAEGKPLESTPWIIWLQGGPGASSLFGLFAEIGPIQIDNGKAKKMPITWGSDYSLLFIDNPIGAGFSYSEGSAFMRNEDDVGAGLLAFLQQFVLLFPELQKAPLFVAGESYAGKYIPAIGHYIHHYNKKSAPINLKGLSIGDGWSDPPTLLYYSDLLLELGFIEPEKANEIKNYEDAARKAWDAGKIGDYERNAGAALNSINIVPNVYNYIKDTSGISSNYVQFVNKRDVRKALHVGQIPYHDLNIDVYTHFAVDFYLSVKPWLEELLEHYGVLCYNGQLDVIVGYALSVHTYHSLKWSGTQAYLEADRTPINSLDPNSTLNPIGYIKAGGNFMDVMIRAAGHMVPADQPRAAKEVIDMFINKFK